MEVEKSLPFQSESTLLHPTSLFKNKAFVFLWIATAFSSMAFSIYLTTEAWLVVDGMGLKVWLGIIMMMTTLPRVFLMVFGGVIADRKKRSIVLFNLNVMRGLLIIGLSALLYADLLHISVLAIFALCFGILDAFFWPASNSLIPTIIEKERIVRANSIIQTSNQITFMVAPAIAGFMIKFRSYEEALILAGVLILTSALFIRNMNEERKQPASSNEKKPILKEIKEGIVYVKSIPYLVVSMISSVVVNLFLVGPVNVGIPILVKDSLKGDALDLSYLESAMAIGMVIGAVFIGIVNIKKKRPVISLSLIFALGISSALLSQISFLWQGLALLMFSGICLSISNIISPSLTQEIVEPHMMGRVQSLMATSSSGLTPLSFAIVSALLSVHVPVSLIMLISCTFMSLYVLIVLLKVKVVWTIN